MFSSKTAYVDVVLVQLLMESQDAFARCQAAFMPQRVDSWLMPFLDVDYHSPALALLDEPLLFARPFVLFLALSTAFFL